MSYLPPGPSSYPYPQPQKRKSSSVAKERRNQINHTLGELSSILFPGQDRLDKLTVVRLATATIKLHTFISSITREGSCHRFQRNTCHSDHFSKILKGFVIITSPEGQILHVSDCIRDSLEHWPHSVVGESISSLIHPEDRADAMAHLNLHEKDTTSHPAKRRCLRQPHTKSEKGPVDMGLHFGGVPHLPCGYSDLNNTPSDDDLRDFDAYTKSVKRQFFCRMKCVQQRKLKRLVKSWGYKTVFVDGHEIFEVKDNKLVTKGFIGHVTPLQPPAIFEVPLVEGSFMTHHSLNFNFIFTDKRLQAALGYLPEEILGQSIYDLVHTDDLFRLGRFHKNLLDKGECISGYFRLHHQSREWCTVQSQANIVYGKKDHKTPDYIVCITYLIGKTFHGTDKDPGVALVPEKEIKPSSSGLSLPKFPTKVTVERAPHPDSCDSLLETGGFPLTIEEIVLPRKIERVLTAPLSVIPPSCPYSFPSTSSSSQPFEYQLHHQTYHHSRDQSRDQSRDVTAGSDLGTVCHKIEHQTLNHYPSYVTNTNQYHSYSEMLSGDTSCPPGYGGAAATLSHVLPYHTHTICHLPSNSVPTYHFLPAPSSTSLPLVQSVPLQHVGNYMKYLQQDEAYHYQDNYKVL